MRPSCLPFRQCVQQFLQVLLTLAGPVSLPPSETPGLETVQSSISYELNCVPSKDTLNPNLIVADTICEDEIIRE